MTTIANLKESVLAKITEIRKDFNYESDDTDDFIVECEVCDIITSKMIYNTSYESVKISAYNSKEIYTFNDDSFLQTLRNLYAITTNDLIKSVVASVGKDKKFTTKQRYEIVNEMYKLNKLVID